MPWLDKNGHVKPESERSQPKAEDATGKEKQLPMVAMEDSFSEIAKVMQDCENETQESTKVDGKRRKTVCQS